MSRLCAKNSSPASEVWAAGTPDVPLGGVEPLWCAWRRIDGVVEHGPLQYANHHARAHFDSPPRPAIGCELAPGGNEFLWTGWFWPQVGWDQLLHSFLDGEVIAWMRLPVYRAGGVSRGVGSWAALVDAALRFGERDRDSLTVTMLAEEQRWIVADRITEADGDVCARVLAAEVRELHRQLDGARAGYRFYVRQAEEEIRRLESEIEGLHRQILQLPPVNRRVGAPGSLTS